MSVDGRHLLALLVAVFAVMGGVACANGRGKPVRVLRGLLSFGLVFGLYLGAFGCVVAAVVLHPAFIAGVVGFGAAAIATMVLQCCQPHPGPPTLPPDKPEIPGMDWGVAHQAVTPAAWGRVDPLDPDLVEEDARMRASLEERGGW